MNQYQIHGLPDDPFLKVFSMSDEELLLNRIKKLVVEHEHAYPCRISLLDAAVGETVYLLNFEHQPAPSYYQASGPIYIRQE